MNSPSRNQRLSSADYRPGFCSLGLTSSVSNVTRRQDTTKIQPKFAKTDPKRIQGTIIADPLTLSSSATARIMQQQQEQQDEATLLRVPATGEADSRGPPPVTLPIHLNLVGATRVTLPSPLTLPDPSPPFVVEGTPTSRPRLTLSAFRRPEHTVRLTRSDPSRRLEKEYSLRSKGCGILGHGAFSTVRLARRRQDGLKVAIKSIAKHEALRARRLRRGTGSHQMDEWEVMEQMKHHPYVVSLLDIFETDDMIHLVTEYCEGGELFDAIQKKRNRSPTVRRGHYSETQAACITRQLLIALKDLHTLRLIHRDVKPENIVLVSDDDNNIHAKLCDFGMARTFDREYDSDTETPPSTPGRKNSFCAVACDYYAAPEVCLMGSALRPSADIYSLGVVLYILLSGFPPVVSDDLSGNIQFPGNQWAGISDGAKHFIRQMLHPDPNKRITAEKALRSDWIRRNSFPRRTVPSFVSPPTSMVPSLQAERGAVNDQVRNRLLEALSGLESSAGAKRRGSDVIVSPRRKRRRGSMDCQRRSSIVCAMKELYSDVATVSAAAEAAAAGVICTEKKDVHVLSAEVDYGNGAPEKRRPSLKSPQKPTVSI